MWPLLAGAAALLLLGGGKSAAKPPKLPAVAPRIVAPRGVVTLGPVRVIKSTPVATAPKPKTSKPVARQPSGMSAPLAKNPSQGGSPPLAAPLSADIQSDTFTPATPRPASTPRSQIPGYKPDAARRGAPSVSAHLKRAGKAGYDRRLLKTWQTQAGLKPDGLYGPGTRGALVFFGQKDPPAAFAGSGTTPYKPPV